MHVHASALDFLVVGAYLVIFSFLWRQIAGRFADRPIGKAMGAII